MKKSTTKKIITGGVLLIVLAAIIFVGIRLSSKKAPEAGEQAVAAMVNGEPLYAREVESKYERLPPQVKPLITPEAFLNETINALLLVQEAKRQGISVPDEEISRAMDELESQAPSQEEFEKLVVQQGFTLDEVRGQLHDQLLVNKLLNQSIMSQLDISDSRIEDYYKANSGEFTASGDRIFVSHILAGSKEAASDVLQRLKKGGDFKKLAKELSLDKSSGERGGFLGLLPKGVSFPDFEAAAFALEEGELSEPVETPFGFHIIRREKDTLSVADAREQVEQTLKLEMMNTALKTYLSQLRANAHIEIIGEGEKAPEQAPITPEAIKTPEAITFIDTGKDICKKGGLPAIYFFSKSTCGACRELEGPFREALASFEGKAAAYRWELDTGDNLLSDDAEKGIPGDALAAFKEGNPKLQVPFFNFGCRYTRVGKAYKAGADELAEFTKILTLVVESNG
ncbi:peptidylprolyl isomerase [Candidatus Woesearchaeota archaeon]|nr:peptidylprolyl isomerase [Candidatus Woesearchaeota archaeon]